MVGGDPIWLNDDPDDDPMCPGDPIWPWGSPNPPPSTQSGSIDRPVFIYSIYIEYIYIYHGAPETQPLALFIYV